MSPKPRVRANTDWVIAKSAYLAAKGDLQQADQAVDFAGKALAEVMNAQAQDATERSTAVADQVGLVGATKAGRGRHIGTWGAVEVYEWWIVTREGEGPARGAQAIVSRTGDLTTYNTVSVKVKKKGGLGGAAVGALLSGGTGAVIGFGLRRKTEVETINKPKTVDTREEMVQIFSKAFAYTAHFSGWGSGTALANAVNRQARETSSPKKELEKRTKALAGLKKEMQKASQSYATRVKVVESSVDKAWSARNSGYRKAEKLWSDYVDARPGLIRHVALSLVPARPGFHPLSAGLVVTLCVTYFVALSGSAAIGQDVLLASIVVVGAALLASLAWMRGFSPRERNRHEG